MMTRSKSLLVMMVLSVGAFAGCQAAGSQPTIAAGSQPTTTVNDGQPLAGEIPDGHVSAVFAGGCFWCMEGPFESLDGVLEVYSGYTGGAEENPTYRQVSSGRTSHTEAVLVIYDENVVRYEQLLDTFWRSMDPTDLDGQFADRGPHYRPAIFVANDVQRAAAERSKLALGESGVFDEPIVVPVQAVEPFYVAEDYHQNYYRTNTAHYQRYRAGSGRERFLRQHWGDEAH
ncbi:MAG: methionine-S-sulfoxide reductase [Bradymonadia bacterium]|jgi:methionine-S-sulfoxide reductase